VQGHAGQLILGKLGGINVVGLKGRVHYYEGNPRAMVIPVYAAKLLGAKTIFITNAAGSLREEMGPGALVPPPPPSPRNPKLDTRNPDFSTLTPYPRWHSPTT
jgi:purine nucleoside phosphorylase